MIVTSFVFLVLATAISSFEVHVVFPQNHTALKRIAEEAIEVFGLYEVETRLYEERYDAKNPCKVHERDLDSKNTLLFVGGELPLKDLCLQKSSYFFFAGGEKDTVAIRPLNRWAFSKGEWTSHAAALAERYNLRHKTRVEVSVYYHLEALAVGVVLLAAIMVAAICCYYIKCRSNSGGTASQAVFFSNQLVNLPFVEDQTEILDGVESIDL